MKPVDPRLVEARKAVAERRLPAAQTILSQILTADPGHAEATFLMGRTAQEAGNAAAAADILARANALSPQAAEPVIYLARALVETGRPVEAKAAGLAAAQLSGASAAALDTLCVVLTRTGEHARAMTAAREATRLDPRRAAYWRNLGWAQLYLGDILASEQAFRRAMALDPNDVQAPAALVELKLQTPDDNIRPTLESLYRAPALTPERRLGLAHALAKTYEDMGEPLKAFDILGEAKAERRAAVRYDPARDEALFAAAAATTNGSVPAGSYASAAAPIFVLGLPRSGTTLIDRILSSHPEVGSTGEPMTFLQTVRRQASAPPQVWLDPQVFERAAWLDQGALGHAYLAATVPLANGAPRLLDKTPVNYLFAGLIQRALPNARIVCVRRDPLDSVLSLYRQSFGPRTQYQFLYGLEDIARYYVQFDRLAAHWRAVLPAQAFREVQYEAVVAALEPQARAMLDFCDLDWDPDVLSPHANRSAVDSASAAQARRPVYASSVGRWRRYGERLEPARRILFDAGLIDDNGDPRSS